MSFPWQNDSAELEAMEELPGGILDSTPSPTPSPASTRPSSPSPPPSPEPEVGTRPKMGVQTTMLPPLMPAHLSASTNEQTGRFGRPTAGKPSKLASSGRPTSSLAPRMQAGPSGSSRPPASRLSVKSGQTQRSIPLNAPARTLSAVALGKQPCRSGSAINEAQQDAHQQASGCNHPTSHNQRRKSNMETTVTQTESDDDAAANDASGPRAIQMDGYVSDNSDVSYVEVAIGTPVASGSMPVAEPEPSANPATASQPLKQSGRPRMEGSSSSPTAGLSKVALGKQRCISPALPTSAGQAGQAGTREPGRYATMAEVFPLKAANPSINNAQWASSSSYTSKWATASAPAPRYTSKWATPQPEDVPDADEQSGGEEPFDAFDEDFEEEDIDDGEISGVEEHLDEDEAENEDDGMMVDEEDEDDGMSIDEEEPHQDDDDDDMSVDEEERADEPEDVDMLVDDPEEEDYGMQVDLEPPFATPKEPPVPPQPSDFRYHFHSPPAPQQQETRFREPRPFFQYFAPQPQPPLFASNPVFTESRQEARDPQTSQSMPAPASSQPYAHEQQPYTPCASYVPYHPPQQSFQPYYSAPSSNYPHFPPPPPTYFYPFHNQTTTPPYTFAQFNYHNSQTYSGQLRFKDNCFAREGELRHTQQYSDEYQPKQSFARAFVATVRRLLKRRGGREDEVQHRNETCVHYVEHESRRFEEHTDGTEEKEASEDDNENEEDEDNQLQVQITGAYKPDAKQARHISDARQDRQHEGMLETLAKETGRLIQENKWITLPAIGLAVYSFAPTLVGLLTSG